MPQVRDLSQHSRSERLIDLTSLAFVADLKWCALATFWSKPHYSLWNYRLVDWGLTALSAPNVYIVTCLCNIYSESHNIRERTITGSVWYRNRYWVYCIESADIACITAGSAPVDGSHYTADQRTFTPGNLLRVCARVHAVSWSMIWERVGRARSRRRL